jgi:transposase-like protein
MAKIPQGEWNAIAARYSKGESLSSIARDYGCTPPAIHYILKRVKGMNTDTPETPLVRTQPAAQTVSQRRPDDGRTVQSIPSITVKEDIMSELQPLALRQHRIEKSEPRAAPAARPAQNGQRPLMAAQKPPGVARTPALTAELDVELQAHTEAAIQAFRSSFAAALAEGSPATRERLRQAASDLMRAAARTTIVLDRVSADGKHARFDATD